MTFFLQKWRLAQLTFNVFYTFPKQILPLRHNFYLLLKKI